MRSQQPENATDAKQLYTCGMHPQVVQDHPGNCPICHMKLVPMHDDGGGAPPAEGKRKVLYYWDPMLGPSSITDHPGKSAMGMELVPVYADQQSAGPTVRIDPTIIQNMGMRTAEVARGPLTLAVRAVGILMVPEPGLHDVSVKFNGWIDKLYADTDGMVVKKDQPLFEVYSPELLVAEDELIMAARSLKALDPSAAESARGEAESTVLSAKRKLSLWGIADQDVEAIASADHAPRSVALRSPADGHIVEKQIVQGSAVQMGTKVMRIEDHSTLWLDTQVFEEQLPWVSVGQTVQATIDSVPGEVFTGKVSFIHPHLDHMTRSATVRTVLDNPKHQLRPGMYATAKIITQPVSDAILVPIEAVIDTGARQIAFVAMPQGRFEPRKVTTGLRGDERVQILAGLAPGESVVTSGQFLMDVESRTTEAIEKLRSGSQPHPQSMPSMPAESPATDNSMKDMPAMKTTATAPMPTSTSAANSKPLTVAYCPMKQASWIQSGDDILNPYFGQEMSGCGEVTKHLAAPAADAPLKDAIDSYLPVQRNLNSDKLGASEIDALQKAMAKLDGEKYSALRAAVGKLAAAKDIAAARVSFQNVSDELMRLLPEVGK
jgi:RND family efflux transporter MFP subunit